MERSRDRDHATTGVVIVYRSGLTKGTGVFVGSTKD